MKRMRIVLLLAALCLLVGCGTGASGASDAVVTEPPGTSTAPSGPDAPLPEQGAYTVQKLCFTRDGLRIYGELYLPAGEGPFPTVIIGHGLDSNLNDTRSYAEAFAGYGIAAYIFDFIGGGSEIRSDGDLLDMTVLTETQDMLTVLEGLRALEVVDVGKLFLMGLSQGGFVATCAAARQPVYVRGLIAFYPAYGLQEDVKERTANGNHITEETTVMNGVTVSEQYMRDALSFNLFSEMKNYTGGVLIVHGTEDEVTPLDYSYRAAETMANVRLIPLEGAGHGFHDEEEVCAVEYAVRFIQKQIGS